MNNAIAVAGGPDRPPALPLAWHRAMAALANGIENDTTTRPASWPQLKQIAARAAVLRCALVAGPVNRLRLAVALILSHWYPGRSLPRERADAIVGNYVLVLEPLPAWAVEAGGLRLIRGEVAGVNVDFPPSSARLYRTAHDELVPYRAELIRLIAIERASRNALERSW